MTLLSRFGFTGGLSADEDEMVTTTTKKRRRSSSSESSNLVVTKTTPLVTTVTTPRVATTTMSSNMSPMKITFSKSPVKGHTTVTPSHKVQQKVMVNGS